MPTMIRFAEERDAVAVQAIYAPFCESAPISFEVMAPSVEEMARRIRKITAHFPWLVCDHQGTIPGYAYASPHRERAAYQWAVDVTVYVGAGLRRAGLGRALYTSLFPILALQGYYKAYAGITLPNPASVGLHEAMDFEPVGVYRHVGFKLGKWHDVGWWQRALRPESDVPEPPRGLGEVRDSQAVQEALRAGASLI